jgi:hypothetical protein
MNFGNKHIKIKVYANDHPPPHCHLIRSDGSVIRFALPTLVILTGPELTRIEKEMILKSIDKICAEYEKLNPDNH